MRKTAQLSVRITADEMDALRELATRKSILLSQLVRVILAANTEETTPTTFSDAGEGQNVTNQLVSSAPCIAS
jgi:hypothetical protein